MVLYDNIYHISFYCFFVSLWFLVSLSYDFRSDTLYNWQIILLCKSEISFIVCRDCHNCSCSISSEDIICYSDRNWLLIEWVDSVSASEDSCFVFVKICSLEFSFIFALFDVFFYCFGMFGCCNFGQQGMFGSKCDIRHPIHGVDTSGID